MLLHLLNRLKGKLHELSLGTPRSSHWRVVERVHLHNNPTCAACGGRKAVQVHHCLPFHLFPKLELVPDNLISLCMGRNACHYELGHPNGWSSYNPLVREDAAEALMFPELRQEIVRRAKTGLKK